jgi:hypothetical protein
MHPTAAHLHRRQFVRGLAAGASAAALAPTSPVIGNEPDKEAAPRIEPAKTETDARMELVLSRFGKHLDDNTRDVVRAEVASIVHRAESLRKFPLTNGDGPFSVFTPFRAPLERNGER